jgi:anti-sigma factor ChrR (cupin superfamily)
MKPDNPVENTDELAALYAAGALPPEEAREVEYRLGAGDRTLGAEVASYAAVLLALADGLGPVEPAPAVKRALLKKAAGSRRAGTLVRRADADGWQESGAPGVRQRILFHDPARNILTRLIQADPGSTIPVHPHDGDEECYVLAGDFRSHGTTFYPGDYLRCPSGSRHPVSSSERGCLILVTLVPDSLPPR